MRIERVLCDNCGVELDTAGYPGLRLPPPILSSLSGIDVNIVGGLDPAPLDLCNGCTTAAGVGMSQGLTRRRNERLEGNP